MKTNRDDAKDDLRDITNREVEKFVTSALNELAPRAVAGKLFEGCPRCGNAKEKNKRCSTCGFEK